jgi:hypothetical protein
MDVKGIKSLQPISFESSVCEQEDNKNRITKIDEKFFRLIIFLLSFHH